MKTLPVQRHAFSICSCVCVLAACSNENELPGGAAQNPSDAGSDSADPDAGVALEDRELGSTGLFVRDILGFYSGDWGDLLLRQMGDEIWGVYAYEEGSIVGRIEGDELHGWWSEVPSRMPTNDAGEVEFRWSIGASGMIALDGRWRYGDNGAWNEDWDINLVTDRGPLPELVERFSDPTRFPREP